VLPLPAPSAEPCKWSIQFQFSSIIGFALNPVYFLSVAIQFQFNSIVRVALNPVYFLSVAICCKRVICLL
jgi:hypothetical protein